MTDSLPAALDHFAIEALFAEVLLAIEGAPARVSALWTQFEEVLVAHFEHEERTVMTEFLAARPREARTVLQEHRYLRGRVAELRAMLPALPLDSARTFLDELRAHGQHEERVLYRWAESHGPRSDSKAAG
jgi:Hemerythrin HHE cation binding domain